MKFKTLTVSMLVIVAYIAIIGYVRISNDQTLEQKYYQSWRKDYIKTQNSNEQYVNAGGNSKKPFALSEAQGYGMLLAVKAGEKHLGSQKDFQELDNYYLAHRIKNSELMSWKQENGKKGWEDNPVSASDGDVMIAQALLRAEKIWPGHGYKNQAKKLIYSIKNDEVNSSKQMLTVGNWAKKDSHFYNLMRTSDVMPKAFDEFYQATGDNSWLSIKKQMLKYISNLSKQHKTGLVPDFAWISNKGVKPAKPNEVATKYDGDFSANACRVPMLLAESDDKEANRVLMKMLNFFREQGSMSAGFTLSGKTLHNYQSASFSAPVFIAISKYRNQGYDSLF